jgi:hypothetical protein
MTVLEQIKDFSNRFEKGVRPGNELVRMRAGIRHEQIGMRKRCDDNKPTCVGRDTRRYCGPGRTAMKYFTDGVGTNWHACKNK